MAEFLDYRFTATVQTIDGIRAELVKFRRTLDEFTNRYKDLARRWGGTASQNAALRAKDINALGEETAGIVNRFLDEYEGHYHQARTTENRIADRFA